MKNNNLPHAIQNPPIKPVQQENEEFLPFGQFPPHPLLLTIPQVAQQLALSPAKVYHLVALERLPTVKFGRAVRVSYSSLLQWVKEREQEQQLQ